MTEDTRYPDTSEPGTDTEVETAPLSECQRDTSPDNRGTGRPPQIEPAGGQFINTLFEGHAEDEVVLIARNIDGKFTQLPYIESTLASWHRAGHATYVNTSTIKADCVQLDRDGTVGFLSRRSEDTVACYMVVLDDIGTKCKEPPVEPSWKIETSPGNFQWGYLLEPTEDFDLVKRFTQALADAGYTDGGALGHNRLVRVPGSTNTKDGMDGWQAVVTDWHPDLIWALEELIEAFGVPLGDPIKPRRHRSPVEAAFYEGVHDPLLDLLLEKGQVLGDPSADWVAVLCPNHAEHTNGDLVAYYCPLGRGELPDMRGFKCHHGHCNEPDQYPETPNRTTWDTRGYLDWVAEQPWGRRFAMSGRLELLQLRFVVVGEGERVCDLPAMLAGQAYFDIPLRSFRLTHGAGRIAAPTADNLRRTLQLASAFIEHADTQRADRYLPDPALDPGLKPDGTINSYVPPRWTGLGDPEALKLVLKHIDFLCGSCAETFLRWLAYKVQNPAKRSFAVLMIAKGEQGIGRSTLGDILRGMWGHRCRIVDIGDLTGHGGSAQFNDWMSGSQMVIVEEVLSGDDQRHWRAYENIKTAIDPRAGPRTINTKYGTKRQEIVHFNVLAFSNHLGALQIPDEDRRFMVVRNPDKRRDDAYYARLRGAMGEGMYAALWHHLKTLDLSAFNPNLPPVTQTKLDLMDAGRGFEDGIVEDVLNDGPDLWTLDDLHKAFDRRARQCAQDPNPKAKTAVLKHAWNQMERLKEGKNGYRARRHRDYPVEVRACGNGPIWRQIVVGENHNQVQHELTKHDEHDDHLRSIKGAP